MKIIFTSLFSLLGVLYFLNTTSTFLRYTEPYLIFTPKWVKKTFLPQYWIQNWKYQPILDLIQPREKVALASNAFDLYYFEFNLYPHKLENFNFGHIGQYDRIIVTPSFPQSESLGVLLTREGFRLQYHWQKKADEEYFIWGKG